MRMMVRDKKRKWDETASVPPQLPGDCIDFDYGSSAKYRRRRRDKTSNDGNSNDTDTSSGNRSEREYKQDRDHRGSLKTRLKKKKSKSSKRQTKRDKEEKQRKKDKKNRRKRKYESASFMSLASPSSLSSSSSSSAPPRSSSSTARTSDREVHEGSVKPFRDMTSSGSFSCARRSDATCLYKNGSVSSLKPDEPIVYFDGSSRTFTKASIEEQERQDVHRVQQQKQKQISPGTTDMLNYRKAFGLACGNFAFVTSGNCIDTNTGGVGNTSCEADVASRGMSDNRSSNNVSAAVFRNSFSATVSTTRAAKLTTGTGGIQGSATVAGGQKLERISHKTHPHLYWQCWKCEAHNYKTRHQCHKCNRLFQK